MAVCSKPSVRFALLLLFISIPALAQTPELVVQTGHSLGVESVAFSPDGKLMASGSSDRTVKVWDVASGQELRSFYAFSGSIAFSPDGMLLATGGMDNTLKLWNVTSGEKLRKFTGYSSPVASVAFSPDGRLLASGDSIATVTLWDVATGKEFHKLKGHSAQAYLPDGTYVKGDDGIVSVAFSPDGKLLASGSWDRSLKLWAVPSGKELRTLAKFSAAVASIAFSPDGTLIASGSLDKTVTLLDASSGKELRTLKGHTESVTSVAFSPDGKTLLSSSADKTARLWDVASGRELRALTGHSDSVQSVAFSPDGRWVASGSEDNTLKLWDATDGQERLTLKGRSSFLRAIAFSPDGKTLVSGSNDNLWILNTTSGQSSHVRTDRIDSIAFSPDGKSFATGSLCNGIKLWDSGGKQLHALLPPPGPNVLTLLLYPSCVEAVAFSPDGKLLASGSWDNTVRVWDIASRQKLYELTGHSSKPLSVAFSPDGKVLASGGSGEIRLWNVEKGTPLVTIKGDFSDVREVGFSPGGGTLMSLSLGNQPLRDRTKFWDWENSREVPLPDPLPLWAYSAIFDTANVNGSSVAAGNDGNQITLVDLATRKIVASLSAPGENDWLITTPEGLFDGTPAAWKQIIWRFDNNTFNYAPVEAFFKEFYYPGLLQEIMSGNPPKPPLKKFEEIDIRQPSVQITRIDGQQLQERAFAQRATLASSIGKRSVEVTIEIKENNKAPSRKNQPQMSGAQDLRLFRNGSLVRLWQSDMFGKQTGCELMATRPEEPRQAVCKATVQIVDGDNELVAYAFNQENIKSTDSAVMARGTNLKRSAALYVLAIGVGLYENEEYNLDYTVADAQEFGDEVKRQQEKLGRYQRVEVIRLLNQGARKADIIAALKKLGDTVQPEDGVIVYFSGHGTAKKDRFYLIPHDLGYMGPRERLRDSDLKTILSHSISDEELEEVFRTVDAGQLLLMIDACNSGQALEAEEKRRGPMNTKGLAQLAYEKGMYVLTASQSVELAFESKALKHSYLAYALVKEGLKTDAADREPRDGQVLLREWLDYATERVPRLRREKVEGKAGSKSLELVEVGKVQTPRVFYRREPDAQPLVVAKTPQK